VQSAKERLRETGHVVLDHLVVEQTSKSLIPFIADLVNVELGDQNDGRSFVDRVSQRRIGIFAFHFLLLVSCFFRNIFPSLSKKRNGFVNVSRVLCQIMSTLL